MELEECQQLAEEIELEMAMMKLMTEEQRKTPEKLDADSMAKLLKKLRKTATLSKKCRECRSTVQDKLNFKE